MLNIFIEAAFRSLAIAVGVWLVIAVLRIRNPFVQRTSWLAVTIASLSMPLLMQVGTIKITTSVIPAVLDVSELAAVTVVSNDWERTLTTIYLLICSGLLARLSIGILQTWRLTHAAQRVPQQWAAGLDVRATAAIRAPVTFASTILLPANWTSWSTTKLHAVLAHESAHVCNRDFYVQMIAQIYRAIFWFSPFAWWLPKHLAHLNEMISDDAAIDRIADRSVYATVLFEVARDAHRVPASLPMAQTSTVMARVERVLSETTQFAKPRLRARFGVVLALTPLIAFAASSSSINDAQALSETQKRTTVPREQISTAKPVIAKYKDVVTNPKLDPDHPLSIPAYPKQSKLNHETGTAFLQVLVGPNGMVFEAKMQKSSGFPVLDETALATARTKWQFVAGTINKVPASMWVTVPVVFELHDDLPKADQNGNNEKTEGATT